MATHTDYLNLTKPDADDNIALEPFNDNMDTIDGAISSLNDTITNKFKTTTFQGTTSSVGNIHTSLPHTNMIVGCYVYDSPDSLARVCVPYLARPNNTWSFHVTKTDFSVASSENLWIKYTYIEL